MLKKPIALLVSLMLIVTAFSGVPAPSLVTAEAAGYVWEPDFTNAALSDDGEYLFTTAERDWAGQVGIQRAVSASELTLGVEGGNLTLTVVSDSYKPINIQTGTAVGGTNHNWNPAVAFNPTASKEYKATFDASVASPGSTGQVRVRGNNTGNWAENVLTDNPTSVEYTWTQTAGGGNLQIDTGNTAVDGKIIISDLRIEESGGGETPAYPAYSWEPIFTGASIAHDDEYVIGQNGEQWGIQRTAPTNELTLGIDGDALVVTVVSGTHKRVNIQTGTTVGGTGWYWGDGFSPNAGREYTVTFDASVSAGTGQVRVRGNSATNESWADRSLTTSPTTVTYVYTQTGNGGNLQIDTGNTAAGTAIIIRNLKIEAEASGEIECECPDGFTPPTPTVPDAAIGQTIFYELAADANVQNADACQSAAYAPSGALRVNGASGSVVQSPVVNGVWQKHVLISGRTSSWNGIDVLPANLKVDGEFVDGRYTVELTGYIPDDYNDFEPGAHMKIGQPNPSWMTLARSDVSAANRSFSLKYEADIAASQVANFNGFRIQSSDNAPNMPFIVDSIMISVATDVDGLVLWPDPEWNMALASIKDKYAPYFEIGNIMSPGNAAIGQLGDEAVLGAGKGTAEFFKRHYNVVTLENAMKPDNVASRTERDTYDFSAADEVVDWALANGIGVFGHTLVWHSQSPRWVNHNDDGTVTDRATARTNMQNFINAVAGHYKGKVFGWDVVNEAFNNDAGGFDGVDWRTGLRSAIQADPGSAWYEAYANGADASKGESGADYIYDAFAFTRAADPGAKLYYNDFNEEVPAKRDAIALMVEDLNSKWRSDPAYDGRLLIEGIGMQQHHFSDTLNVALVDAAIARFAQTGAKVSITELDLPMGSYLNPYTGKKLTEEEQLVQAKQFAALMLTFMKYSDVIERVSFWGMTDIQSWRGSGMPLLFDNSLRPKTAYHAVMNPEQYASLDEPMTNIPSTPSRRPSSGGGGGGGAPARPTAQPLSNGDAVSAIRSQINAHTGDTVVVTFKNISEVSKDVFDAMVKAADGKTLEARFDTMNGNAVDVRLYIDPATVTGGLNVSASTTNAAAQSTKNQFEKFFENNVAVISFGQQGSFGTEIKVAAKVDLAGMDTENLHFYHYDKATNAYKLIPTDTYRIDANGYLHFTTVLAGDIIITDSPLQKK